MGQLIQQYMPRDEAREIEIISEIKAIREDVAIRKHSVWDMTRLHAKYAELGHLLYLKNHDDGLEV